jgi:hypothetical protein
MMVRKRIQKQLLLMTAIVLCLTFASSAFAQLLFRQGMEDENFAKSGYNKYGRQIISRSSNPRYDYFGNYILNGVSLFHWNEEKINSLHLQTSEAYSLMDKLNPIDESDYYTRYLNEFVVMNETNKSFSSRFMVGNKLGVNFSPLTMNMALFNGIRWDTNFANTNFSVVSSRVSSPLWFDDDYLAKASKNRLTTVYLHGAHIERTMGLFNMSANYVNTYRSNSSMSRSQNSMTGTLGNDDVNQDYRTLQLAVKVEDGSRYDGGGPRVYDIYPVINGKPRRDLFKGITKGNWKKDFQDVKKTSNSNKNFDQNIFSLDPLRAANFSPINNFKKADKLTGTDIIAKRYASTDPLINFKDLNDEGKPYLECNGEDYLIFWFDMPNIKNESEATEVIIKSLVSNNYIFSISEVFLNAASEIDQTTDLPGKSQATFFEQVAFSEGDVKDESNYGWVSFEYGVPMANMLMSFRINANTKGFKLTSEYSRNMQYKQFKTNDSKKFRKDAEAFYVNIEKELGIMKLGTEYFRMDPDYTTTFRHSDPEYKDLDNQWDSQLYQDPVLYKDSNGSMQGILNSTQMINTVDDNDDKDQYPDYHMFRDFRDINGVYPGLDKNGNNRPDTNENDNIIPDYDEPFFLFNSDPDEYDFGVDLNNNGTIDNREDDSKPDYPYDLNRKGYHIFGLIGDEMGWKYTVGYLNMQAIMSGGETDVKYGLAQYNKFIPFLADVKFASMFKKVEDTITDDVFKYTRTLSTTLADSLTYTYNIYDGTTIIDERISDPWYDQLRYRDSYVTTSYFETNLLTIPNMTIGIKLKYDLNHQNETSFQDENDIADRTQIYRAEYKYNIKRLLITPQVKFLNRKYTNHDGYTLTFHEQRFYPIIKAEYPLTLRTSVKVGAQGLPGLNVKVRNLVNNQLDYDSRDMVFMISNSSFYSGYDFCLNFGLQTKWQNFKGEARQSYSRSDRFYFVRFVIGLEPIS